MARRWAGGEEVRGGGEREQRCADTRPERRKEQLAACARWAAARVREGRRRGGGCNSPPELSLSLACGASLGHALGALTRSFPGSHFLFEVLALEGQ